jgi:DNA-binding protein H-NS
MALKETINAMRQHLIELSHDLEKASGGNRAAAQRVRTGSIKFAKISKVFRKESISAEKGAGNKIKKAKKPARKKR